ncbi:glycosyltransferase [Thermodesulforhabdus norvegica]|uniref:Glycosyltransferase Family 4 n=1 Tax=Thermodesulforhabdus norvegica TaxID=39841 RepID=A0A1I4UYV7_9BACT|nr:glycosyltransferase [Thermodesulforhabdus norvegica]SFM94116.1 Glycosyltransferase Family 4 [Thermodesulforhabdus norvegica]
MKIAMVSIPYKTTPPVGYGGIERVVYELTEELIRQGHEVVLFATPGSHCSGETVEIQGYEPERAPSGITRTSRGLSEEPLYRAMREYLSHKPVDVIHDWSFENLFVLRHPRDFPFVISSCVPPHPGYKRPNLVAASRAHAFLFGDSVPYVHYGVDLERYRFQPRKTMPMIHIAKIARYKGQHIAVLAAFLAGQALMLAGNVEDSKYYRLMIRPLVFAIPGVSYIGELPSTQQYLANAKALVQTPRWFDVLPLVIIESLACGTPVIALNRGGISEQIVDGENGFLCESFSQLIRAMKKVQGISPYRCREIAEERFDVRRMASEYIRLYERVINGETW